MASYARVARMPKLVANPYVINIENFEKAKKYAVKNDEKVVVTPPDEMIKINEKLEVLYHTQAMETGRIEKVDTEIIEDCLKDVKERISHVERGMSYGTVVVTYKTEEDAKKYSKEMLKTGKIIMIPSYGGRKMTRVRIGNIPIVFNVEIVLAGLLKEEDMKIEHVATTPTLNWWGYGVEVWLNLTPEESERLPHQILLNGGRWLNVNISGRSPICFRCRARGHIRAYCPEKKEDMVEVEACDPVKEKVEETEKDIESEEGEEEKKYEDGNTDSGEFITPKKKRRKQRKDEVKSEQGRRKNNKEDTLILMRKFGLGDLKVEAELVKKKELFYRPVGADGEARELLFMKRKIYMENGFQCFEVVGEVFAGQKKIELTTSLASIIRMKGQFRQRLWEIDDREFDDEAEDSD